MSEIEPVRHRHRVLVGEAVGIEPEVPVGAPAAHVVEYGLVVELDRLERAVRELRDPRPFARVPQHHARAVAVGGLGLLIGRCRHPRREAPGPEQVVVEDVAAPAHEIRGLGQEQRAARAELVVLLARRPELVVGPGARPARVREPPGQHLAIPPELLGAAAQHGVHHAAHRLPVLGVERAADHLHLLQQGAVDAQARLVVVGVVHRDAVHLELHLAAPPAPEVQVAALRDDAGLEVHHILQLLHRQRADLVAAHGRNVARRVQVHDRSLGADHHFLDRDRSFGEGDVDVGGVVGGDHDAGHGGRAVAEQLDLHVVGAGGDVEDQVAAVGIRERAEPRGGQHHVHAGERLLLGIDDAPGELARRSGRRHPRQQHERDPEAGDRPGDAPAAWTRGSGAHLTHREIRSEGNGADLPARPVPIAIT